MRGMNQLLLAAVCAAGIGLSAADFSAAKLADYNVGKIPGFTATANGFIYKAAKGRMEVLTKGKKAIDLNKKYRFSGSVRLPEGCTDSGLFWLGIKCLDKAGKEIDVTSCNGIPGTITTLAKAVKPGDKEIFLKDASKWKNQYTHAAFGAKADWSDCPNTNLSPKASAITKEGNMWKLTLTQPMKKAYPAGTSVRYHRDGATYIYLFCAKPKAAWSNIKVDFKGAFQTNAVKSYAKFRPGTAAIQLVVFCENGKPCNAEFKDIAVTEIK